jgi:hypothetical protein
MTFSWFKDPSNGNMVCKVGTLKLFVYGHIHPLKPDVWIGMAQDAEGYTSVPRYCKSMAEAKLKCIRIFDNFLMTGELR